MSHSRRSATPLGPFHLIAELGRGASGRTYLATEPALADRPVVLKVISDDQEEHLRLARLQHTHIVPLYSEQTLPDRGLRALCMPYLGGASLAQILDALGDIPLERRRGRDLIEALERVQVRRGPPGSRGFQRAVPALPRGSVLRRGHLLDRDVPGRSAPVRPCSRPVPHGHHAGECPDRGRRPADAPRFPPRSGADPAGEWVLGRLGGTPGWMSPEQEAALDAVAGASRPRGRRWTFRHPSRWAFCCGKALWGTGRETGRANRPPGRDRQRRRPPGVSVGLADILHKCLSSKPSARYPDAAALADDLRLHLNDLPLRGVANRSPLERWRKWQRRLGSPARQATRLTALAGIVVAVVLAAAVYSQRAHEIEANLEDGRRYRLERNTPRPCVCWRRGLERAGAVPGTGHLRRALAAELEMARRGQDAAELHRLADLIRFRYGLAPPETEEARLIARHCRAFWDPRGPLLSPQDGRLDPGTEQGIETDLIELAIVWADLNMRLASRADADRQGRRIAPPARSGRGFVRPQPGSRARATRV